MTPLQEVSSSCQTFALLLLNQRGPKCHAEQMQCIRQETYHNVAVMTDEFKVRLWTKQLCCSIKKRKN